MLENGPSKYKAPEAIESRKLGVGANDPAQLCTLHHTLSVSVGCVQSQCTTARGSTEVSEAGLCTERDVSGKQALSAPAPASPFYRAVGTGRTIDSPTTHQSADPASPAQPHPVPACRGGLEAR